MRAISYDAGLDTAWRLAGTEYLVILGPDLQPHMPGWLRALMTLASEDGTGLAGATPNALVQHETLVLPFRAIATRRSLLAEMGGFDASYGDDMAFADFGLRLRQVGFTIVGTPYAAVTGPDQPVSSYSDLARLRLKWPMTL